MKEKVNNWLEKSNPMCLLSLDYFYCKGDPEYSRVREEIDDIRVNLLF